MNTTRPTLIVLGVLASFAAHANPFDCLIEPSQTVEVRSATEGIIDKVYVQRCSDLNSCFYSSRRTIVVTLGRKW